MKRNLLPALQDVGLTSNEATIYLAALKNGPQTALQLSRMTDIKRATVYLTAGNLMDQGLMNIQMIRNKKHFAAENPEKLDRILSQKQNILGGMMSDLLATYHKLEDSQSFIKHYEGVEGMQSAYEEALKELGKDDFLYAISDVHKWYYMDKDYSDDFIARRIKTGCKTHLLLTDDEFSRMHQKRDATSNQTTKILPLSKSIEDTMMMITSHRILIQQTKNPVITISIENPAVIKMFKAMFNMIWDSTTSA